MYFVYILKCADNSLYTGITNNIQKRLSAHLCGNGSRFVRSRLPAQLAAVIEVTTKNEALKWEYLIKSWSKNEKEEFIKQQNQVELVSKLQQEVTINILGRDDTN
ncbi:GIY-YIG nuclease family protein [candidate division WWE3 bacterium]|nr:GIY-YIG nuclease family protein [candidate division WWE3 bacterium]